MKTVDRVLWLMALLPAVILALSASNALAHGPLDILWWFWRQ